MSVKISELPILDSLADNDVIAGVDTSANVTSKIEMATLKNYIDTNTQYTAGTNIDITNNVVSAPNVYNKTETDELLEEKDEQIEELKSEVDSLSMIYNAFPTESGEGESLTLDDTAEVKFKKFDLKGNTSQTTYSGINLLPEDKYDTTRTANGITFTNNGNGTFSVSGTSTKDTSIDFIPSGNFNLEANQSYYFYSSQPYNANTFNLSIITVESGATRFLQANSTRTTEVASTSARVTLWIPNGTTVNAQNVKLMLVKGTTTPTEYEPYVGGTASPNPTYPQPVNVVSGNNEINVVGKNLLPNNQTAQTINGITFTINSDKSVSLSGTATSITDLYFVGTYNSYGTLPLETGTYNLNGCSGGDNSTYMLYCVGNRNGNLYYYQSINDSGRNIIIEKGDTFRFFIRVMNGVSVNTTIYPQLEKGSSASTYEPYQGNTYNIDLPEGMELCKIGTYQDYIYKDSGKWYLHKEIRKVVLNGSESGWSQYANANNLVYFGISLLPNKANGNNILANYFSKTTNIWGKTSYENGIQISGNNQDCLFITTDHLTIASFKTWLSANNVTTYYVLETPTTTEITYQPLIDQLNLLERAISYDSQTNISQVNNDLGFIIYAEAIKSLENVLDRLSLLE